MSTEACPHCHEQVHKSEDGCGTEKCMARRAFIRQAAIMMRAHAGVGSPVDDTLFWEQAHMLWAGRPEGY